MCQAAITKYIVLFIDFANGQREKDGFEGCGETHVVFEGYFAL